MVTVLDFTERQKEDGTTFLALIVQGGVEIVQSKQTMNFYATAKKASIPSTFDEITCKAMVGSQIPGSIEKQDCEPYEYTIQDTGEVIELNYRYMYIPEDEPKSSVEQLKSLFVPSENGVLEAVH